MNWEIVIGLEIHVQMNTNSKLFCNCEANFTDEPNTHICPVCTGQPGMLPVLNKKAVENAVKLGLATNCTINTYNEFARKNYYYPDLPKGYQISQFDKPICEHGYLDVSTAEGNTRVRITRIHMEEDAGKLVHAGSNNIKDATYSKADLNRSSVPLCEIVSEPEIHSAQEAKAYAEKIQQIVRYLEISDGNMEEGSLRCDANISIRQKGETKLGTKTEVKNLNSFKSIEKAINLEVERQIDILEEGGAITQETRHYNEASNSTKSMRSKEEAHDYRYFPDPDLVPLLLEQEWIEKLKNNLPELPSQKKQRFENNFGLSPYNAEIITAQKEFALFFEETVALGGEPKDIVNWLMTEVTGYLNQNNLQFSQIKLTPTLLAELLKMLKNNIITGKVAKNILPDLINKGISPQKIVKEKDLGQIEDNNALKKIVEDVLAENPRALAEIKAGKNQIMGFLIGQVMKKSQGKANPININALLKDLLQ